MSRWKTVSHFARICTELPNLWIHLLNHPVCSERQIQKMSIELNRMDKPSMDDPLSKAT
jgi:hypothetical protein